MPTLGFIGAGPVGTTFGVRLAEQGYRVTAVSDIDPAFTERFAKLVAGCTICAKNQAVVDTAEMVFITTADDYISKVCSELTWRQGQAVVHCSGASTVQSLDSARRQGALVGSIHPCQTFSGIEQAIENLPGSTFGIEAEGPLRETLTQMARALKGDIVYLTSEDKVLYHAAAAIACNYFTTIVKLATDLWKNFGKTSADGIKAYLPLLRGTLTGIEKVGFPKCLTGPIARGDVATIRRHVAALEKYAPEILPLYKELGRLTIPIGQDKGTLSQDKAEDLRSILKEQER
jgi:predicted short-subunit dehydrogenase-like oxidoreductase (DUF2520 family)